MKEECQRRVPNLNQNKIISIFTHFWRKLCSSNWPGLVCRVFAGDGTKKILRKIGARLNLYLCILIQNPSVRNWRPFKKQLRHFLVDFFMWNLINCCKQPLDLDQLLHPSIHPHTHPGTLTTLNLPVYKNNFFVIKSNLYPMCTSMQPSFTTIIINKFVNRHLINIFAQVIWANRVLALPSKNKISFLRSGTHTHTHTQGSITLKSAFRFPRNEAKAKSKPPDQTNN
jgi:hypothetical protein